MNLLWLIPIMFGVIAIYVAAETFRWYYKMRLLPWQVRRDKRRFSGTLKITFSTFDGITYPLPPSGFMSDEEIRHHRRIQRNIETRLAQHRKKSLRSRFKKLLFITGVFLTSSCAVSKQNLHWYHLNNPQCGTGRMR